MESNNWVFGQTWPWRVITGCFVKQPVITLHGQVWQNTQLLLSMVKSDQTPSYYSPWSSLTKHPVITFHGQVWPNTQLITLQGQVWQNTQLLLSMVKSDQTPSYYSKWSSLTKHPVITLHGQVWPNTQLLLSMIKSDQTPSLWLSLVKSVITGCFVKLDLGE
jgi:hypothetical protein